MLSNRIAKIAYILSMFIAVNISDIEVCAASHTASDLTDQYHNTPRDCGGPGSPAFLCSGIILRATSYNPAYLSWDPSPASQRSGGVSFSYLRKDSGFSKLVFGDDNGFIIYPQFSTPKHKNKLEVLCSYPLDGWTDGRNSHGCGQTPNVQESLPCQDQNITTGKQWADRYKAALTGRNFCGFNVTDGVHNSADAFYQTIQAMHEVASQSEHEQNELRIAAWAPGQSVTMPIQAFFYLKGNSQGLKNAKEDQKRYLKETGGEFVPVIQLTLPANRNDHAAFHFVDSDQAVVIPK